MHCDKALIKLSDVVAAREVVGKLVHHTPHAGSSFLGKELGLRLFFKLELFQKTGSFKPRGVLNKLHYLTPEEKQKGVITLSAGNHGQALAWASAQHGIECTVVMPKNSVRSKVNATRGYGANVVLAEGGLLETCLRIKEEKGLTMIHPFDDPLVIAGQGTLGLEILEDLPELNAVIVGIGGGGLISGIGAAIKAKRPKIKIIGVEPEGAAAMSESLQRGKPVHLDRVDTIADGLAAPFTGEHTLAHVKAYVDQIVTVSDREIIESMWLIMERCKVMVEPAAAATLAALLSGKACLPRDCTALCVLSGGNVDRQALKSLL